MEPSNAVIAHRMDHLVVTTIQAPTDSLVMMDRKGLEEGFRTIVVGDRKTPVNGWPTTVDFLPIDEQAEMDFKLARLLPENHYARKNIGYLLAIARGSSVVFETDDDNSPLPTWKRRTRECSAHSCSVSGWVNVYRWFTDKHIWPRGFPIEIVRDSFHDLQLDSPVSVRAPIQQGLVNGSPDVDAVWRLTLDEEIVFRGNRSVFLQPGSWCPFNSQSTWWFPEAYPLMYLPSFVSFRMTDIWRSFIAQRCLWAMGYGVAFHGAEMVQARNPHHLLKDFEQEIPGYLNNASICKVLENLDLSDDPEQTGENLYRCYEAIVRGQFVPGEEMTFVEAWNQDVSSLRMHTASL